MKLLMLCREPRLYSCQRLKYAAEQAGHSMDILDPNRFLLTLEKGGFSLWYQRGEKYEKTRPPLETVSRYDAVLGRFGTSSTEIGCRVLRHFEGQGVPVLNSAAAFALARDKWRSLCELNAHGISVPQTAISGELVDTLSLIRHIQVPLVTKTLSGSQGVGVMLSESEHNAKSILDTLHAANVTTLQQAFIQEAQGQDIRAFVIGKEVVAAMVRRGQTGEFRANIHQGGTAESITLTETEKQLAIKASQALGLDMAGVDLIRSQSGLMVLEVNASPGLEMIEKVSGQPIAEKMIAYLLQKITT